MSNIQNATVTAQAIGTAFDKQPTWLRYKGTIIIIATGLVSILSQLATLPEWDGTTVGVVFTVAATIIGAAVNRFTKDGFTKSMIHRAARQAPEDAPRDVEVVEHRTINPDLDYADYMANITTPETGKHYAGEV